MSTLPPIRRQIRVAADQQTAFDVFTNGIGRWWPVAEFSVFGADATVALQDGRLVEQAADGRRAEWGQVTAWEPPTELAVTWHPGAAPERASQVRITFAPEASGTGTLVTIEHSGWERFADPAAARAEYDHGWPEVLDRFRAAAEAGADEPGDRDPGQAAITAAATTGPAAEHSDTQDTTDDTDNDDGEWTWVALLHRPGPTAPAPGELFDDARFAEHLAFLGRMRERGYLIAAGPMTDVLGEGMTVLRLPGADQLERAVDLATRDDASVACGFFDVTVRPWHVVMAQAK